MFPTQVVKTGAIHQLAGSAIGLTGIEFYVAAKANDVFYKKGQFLYRYLFAGANVYKQFIVVLFHQKHACISQVIGVHEFSERRTRAPDFYEGRFMLFGFMEFPNQCRYHMRILRMIIVTLAV